MKKRVLYLLMVTVLAFTVGCSSTNNEEKDGAAKTGEVGVKNISVNELNSLKEGDVQYIDTRSEDQYIGWDTDKGPGGHIKGAIDFPTSWFDVEKDSKNIDNELERRGIDKNKKTIIYSNESIGEDIYNNYIDAGFKDIYILDDGFKGYVDAKLDVEKMPNYEILVSPQWVQDLADGKNPETFKGGKFKIVEMAFGDDEKSYKKGHIKGAITVTDSINHIAGPRVLSEYDVIPMEEKVMFWNKASDDKIKKQLEDMGITYDTTVVLYGLNTTAASRAALVMKYAGVEDVRLLNGGKTLCQLENIPFEKGIVEYEPVEDFGVSVPQDKSVFINYDEELKLVDDKNAVITSIRSWDEYIGKKSGYTYIGEAGDIKNSRFGYAGSDPYHMEDFRNLDDTMFNYNIISDRWNKWGINKDKEVSFHCGTGWRASETYIYAWAMGWDNLHVYDGGWYEWHLNPKSPRMDKGLPEDAPEKEPNSFF